MRPSLLEVQDRLSRLKSDMQQLSDEAKQRTANERNLLYEMLPPKASISFNVFGPL